MKYRYSNFFYFVLFQVIAACTTSITIAQLTVKSVSIEASGFTGKSSCSYSDASGHSTSTSTKVGMSFSHALYPGLTLDSLTISANGQYNGYDGFEHHVVLTIELDTVNGKIIKLYTDDSEGHSTYMGSPWYWVDEGNGISAGNIKYHTSPTKDSLIVQFDAYRLKRTNLSFGQHSFQKYPHSGGGCYASHIDQIDDNAYLKIIILGEFPLAVDSSDNTRQMISVFIHPSSKTITIAREPKSQSQSIVCFDILGRKYNLEFLKEDENWHTE